MMPTAAVATSQQPPRPTATASKHAEGPNIPFGGHRLALILAQHDPNQAYIENKYGKIPNPPKSATDGFGFIYGSMARFDAWNLLLWTFEDFNK